MMHMTFYWSKEVTILVDSWRTTSWLAYSFTLITCFLASAFYQFLEGHRVILTRHLSKTSSSSSSDAPVDTPLLEGSKLGRGVARRWSLGRVASGIFFGLNSAIGYLLMLAVMSFNGGVFVSIVLGLAAGYLVFRSGGEESDSSAAEDNPCACA